MPLYDDNVNIDIENQNVVIEHNISFQDGGFFPFLKYLIHKATNLPLERIAIRDYNQENIFLNQDDKPCVFCEIIDYESIAMSGEMYGNGDIDIINSVKYRVYSVNDSYRIPLLIEYALKANPDDIVSIIKEISDTELGKTIYNKYLDVPSTITMSRKKTKYMGSIYPVVAIDITMVGKMRENLENLKNMPFDDIAGGIKFTFQ